jgi:hypothetical protein
LRRREGLRSSRFAMAESSHRKFGSQLRGHPFYRVDEKLLTDKKLSGTQHNCHACDSRQWEYHMVDGILTPFGPSKRSETLDVEGFVVCTSITCRAQSSKIFCLRCLAFGEDDVDRWLVRGSDASWRQAILGECLHCRGRDTKCRGCKEACPRKKWLKDPPDTLATRKRKDRITAPHIKLTLHQLQPTVQPFADPWAVYFLPSTPSEGTAFYALCTSGLQTLKPPVHATLWPHGHPPPTPEQVVHYLPRSGEIPEQLRHYSWHPPKALSKDPSFRLYTPFTSSLFFLKGLWLNPQLFEPAQPLMMPAERKGRSRAPKRSKPTSIPGGDVYETQLARLLGTFQEAAEGVGGSNMLHTGLLERNVFVIANVEERAGGRIEVVEPLLKPGPDERESPSKLWPRLVHLARAKADGESPSLRCKCQKKADGDRCFHVGLLEKLVDLKSLSAPLSILNRHNAGGARLLHTEAFDYLGTHRVYVSYHGGGSPTLCARTLRNYWELIKKEVDDWICQSCKLGSGKKDLLGRCIHTYPISGLKKTEFRPIGGGEMQPQSLEEAWGMDLRPEPSARQGTAKKAVCTEPGCRIRPGIALKEHHANRASDQSHKACPHRKGSMVHRCTKECTLRACGGIPKSGACPGHGLKKTLPGEIKRLSDSGHFCQHPPRSAKAPCGKQWTLQWREVRLMQKLECVKVVLGTWTCAAVPRCCRLPYDAAGDRLYFFTPEFLVSYGVLKALEVSLQDGSTLQGIHTGWEGWAKHAVQSAISK